MPALDATQKAEMARSELRAAQAALDDPVQALQHLRKAEEIDPLNPDVLAFLGKTQIKLGDYVDSVATYDRLAKIEPNDEDTLTGLAFSHRRLKHFGEAKRLALEVLGRNQGNRVAREVLADCFIAEGDYRACLGELNKLNRGAKESALARLSEKAAYCLYRVGSFHHCWEVCSTLIESGYTSDLVENLYHLSESEAKQQIERDMGNASALQRLFLKLADKAIIRMILGDRKKMETLQSSYEEASIELAETKEEHQAALAVAEDHERRANEAARAARTDSLTGLPNRMCLLEDYVPKIGENPSVGVVLLDLDKFKDINTFHGHPGGDIILKRAADILGSVFRHPQSNVFRYGGEEFVALIFDSQENILRLAEHARAELERRGAPELKAANILPVDPAMLAKLHSAGVEIAGDGVPLMTLDANGNPVERLLTGSFGVAMYPKDGASWEELYHAADGASNAAKAAGRNRVHVYSVADADANGQAKARRDRKKVAKGTGEPGPALRGDLTLDRLLDGGPGTAS